MKKQIPNSDHLPRQTAGRPTNRPDPKLDWPGPLSSVAERVRKIMEQSRMKHPGLFDSPDIRLTDKTLALVLEFFGMPGVIDATWKPKNKIEREHILPVHTSKAIRWAKMFADAPDAMIEALPKIKKKADASGRSPRQAVIRYVALRHALTRFHGRPAYHEFWTKDAGVLADELKTKLKNSGITQRTINHARQYIEKFCKGIMPGKIEKNRQ